MKIFFYRVESIKVKIMYGFTNKTQFDYFVADCLTSFMSILCIDLVWARLVTISEWCSIHAPIIYILRIITVSELPV